MSTYIHQAYFQVLSFHLSHRSYQLISNSSTFYCHS
nr:MAG TPA: hypothetical protein [Caudoviricetes sp.]